MAEHRARRAAAFLAGVSTFEDGVENGDALEAMTAPPATEPVTGFAQLADGDKRAVEGAMAKLLSPEAMDDAEADALEAIILPDKRPVIDILSDDYVAQENDWLFLNSQAARASIVPAIPAIGRLDLPDHPFLPYAGTAFVVGSDLLMTNRHVAEIVATGLGRSLAFKPDITSRINFAAEATRPGDTSFVVDEAVLIHPYWDMALLRVRGLDPKIQPLRFARDPAVVDRGADVAVIGYPAYDPTRNDIEVQRRVFRNLFNVKRLQPGKLVTRKGVRSFGKMVEAFTHDSCTLGGDSGAAVIDVATGLVAALHFGGRYLEANYAVPACDMALDDRLVDFGLLFETDGPPRPKPGPWDDYWRQTEEAEAPKPQGGCRGV